MSDLPEPLVEAIESRVDAYRREISSVADTQPARPIGWLKDQGKLPETFFDPLSVGGVDLKVTKRDETARDSTSVRCPTGGVADAARDTLGL